MVRLLLAMRLSRASVLLSKLLLWSPDIDGEAALWRRATRALGAAVGLGNVELAEGGHFQRTTPYTHDRRGENRDARGSPDKNRN